MPLKSKEERAEYDRLYRKKNREKKLEYERLYRKKNKEKIAEYDRVYYEKNKDKIAEYDKVQKKTPEGLKVSRLSDWKRRGLIHDDLDELYERYLQSTHCDECEEEFVNDRGISQRCMDHCHISGLFRNFLCKSCNLKRG
jgi:hypothetical protein